MFSVSEQNKELFSVYYGKACIMISVLNDGLQ